jgi:hypothetical protein
LLSYPNPKAIFTMDRMKCKCMLILRQAQDDHTFHSERSIVLSLSKHNNSEYSSPFDKLRETNSLQHFEEFIV